MKVKDLHKVKLGAEYEVQFKDSCSDAVLWATDESGVGAKYLNFPAKFDNYVIIDIISSQGCLNFFIVED